MFVVEVADGEITASGWDGTDEMLLALASAERVDVVPLPRHEHEGRFIAYCDADARNHPPNCRVDGYAHPIHGPLIIVGVDGDGHRPLDHEEAGRFWLDPPGTDGLPVLRAY